MALLSLSWHFLFHIVFLNFLLFSKFSYQEKIVFAKDMRFELNTGDLMPMVGLGTAGIHGSEPVKNTLDIALASGYRLIDTAAGYRNEEEIGKALKELLPKYNLSRKDIFITTKLASSDLGEKAYEALEHSLKKLDCEYVDLYLIHHPENRAANLTESQNIALRDKSWQQLVKGKKNGLARNIGVSNYDIRHLTELLNDDHGVKPAVNQVKWDPYNHQDDLLDFCKKKGILLQAYSSLGGGRGFRTLLADPEFKKIGLKLGKSPAQVVLRWALQQNIAVIPKSKSEEHLKENIDLNFVISEEDMNIVNKLNVIGSTSSQVSQN